MRLVLSLIFTVVCLGNLRAEESPWLSPSIYLYGYYGSSTADHPGDFAPGGHDPSRKEAWVLQAAEPSISLRWGEHLQGFVNGIAFSDENDDLEWEWEEYFLKLTDLPGGFELRGGRMLSRLGFHNANHLHSWTTVDAPMPHSLFLGEHGVMLEGGDLSIYMDTDQVTVLTLGFGQRPSYDHEHGHAEEEEADHEEEHEEHEEEGLAAYEAYRAQDDVVTLGLRRDHVFNDFQVLRAALFGGMGDNEMGESSWFAGAGLEFQWRKNGLEPGGQSLRWRTEVIRFDGGSVEAHDHEDDHAEEIEEEHDEDAAGRVSNWGISSEIEVQLHPRLVPFARMDYAGASDVLDLPEWVRYTVGMTFPITQSPNAFIRLQGNADERGDESEQSFWAQFGVSWGGGEVR